MESNLVENINIQKCFSRSVRKLDGILSYLSRASVLGESFLDGRREQDCKVTNSSDQDWRRFWYGNIKVDQVKLSKHLRKSNQVWWLPHSLGQLAMHPVPPPHRQYSLGAKHTNMNAGFGWEVTSLHLGEPLLWFLKWRMVNLHSPTHHEN